MKIEMGESLFYSWLRHVKACQIVQTNWKVSQHWELKHEAEIEAMMKTIDNHFSSKYGYGMSDVYLFDVPWYNRGSP